MEQLLKSLEKNYPDSRYDTNLEDYMKKLYNYIIKNKTRSLLFLIVVILLVKSGNLSRSFIYQLIGFDIPTIIYVYLNSKTRTLISLFKKLEGHLSYKNQEMEDIIKLTDDEKTYLNILKILEMFIKQKNKQPAEKQVLFKYTSFLLKIIFRFGILSNPGDNTDTLFNINEIILDNYPYSELKNANLQNAQNIDPGSVPIKYRFGYYPQNRKTIFMINLYQFLSQDSFQKLSEINELNLNLTSEKILKYSIPSRHNHDCIKKSEIIRYAFPEIERYFSYLESFPETSAKQEYLKISGIEEKLKIFEEIDKITKFPKVILKIIADYYNDDNIHSEIFNNIAFRGMSAAEKKYKNLLSLMTTYNPIRFIKPEESSGFLRLLEQNGYTKEIYNANKENCLKNLEIRVCRELKLVELPQNFMSVYSYKKNEYIHLRDLVKKEFTTETEHIIYILLIRYETALKNSRRNDFAYDYYYENSGELRGYVEIPITGAGFSFENIHIILFLVAIIILILVLLVFGLWSRYSRNPDGIFWLV